MQIGRRTAVRSFLAACAAMLAGCAAPPGGSPPPADLVVHNARIATLDADSRITEAIAVKDGRIVALGSAATARIGAGTRTIDAGGRTVVPGLIDSHMHAIRAALSYSTEVNWIGARDIPEAMARLRTAAERMPPDSWLIVAGGWTEQQFVEKRRPTVTELNAAAPGRPIWVQLFYDALVLTPKARAALDITNDRLPVGMTPERDASGAPTGWYKVGIVGLSALFDRLPKPTYEDNLIGTRRFFRELNRLAITGVIDPGGFSISAPQYAALFQTWRQRELTVRVAYSLFAQRIGQEADEFRDLTQLLPMGFGDDWLHFNGIGERITGAMYNNEQPDAAAREKFFQIALWAARRGLTLTIHWQENASVGQLLDLFEQVNAQVPIAPLRWSIAHLNDGSAETFARMKTLGVGWTLQDAMYFQGDAELARRGDAARRMPPIMTALRAGVMVGAGTDAHRVASYNPFVALQWMVDGRTVGGTALRTAEETPTREQALRLYTSSSAWFSFDERRRGSLELGKLADFAVLSDDYFAVPTEQISRIESLLTVVGGRVVYAAAPFGGEDVRPSP